MTSDDTQAESKPREAGHAIKTHTLFHLDSYLAEFERNCTRAGGVVHWLGTRMRRTGSRSSWCGGIAAPGGWAQKPEVIKVKTMTSDETGLNRAFAEAGIVPWETDLADMIVQMGRDQPSHMVAGAA